MLQYDWTGYLAREIVGLLSSLSSYLLYFSSPSYLYLLTILTIFTINPVGYAKPSGWQWLHSPKKARWLHRMSTQKSQSKEFLAGQMNIANKMFSVT